MFDVFIRSPRADVSPLRYWIQIPISHRTYDAKQHYQRMQELDLEIRGNWGGNMVGSTRQAAIFGFNNFEDAVPYLIYALKMNDV